MDRERLARRLEADEGLKLLVYRCPAGKLSIGVGRNLEDRGITEAEARMLLDNDIRDFWGRLCAALPWVASAPDEVQEVLTNMAFNLGLHGLLGFRVTLGFLQNGKYAEAADEMLKSKWAGQVGDRALRLAATLRGVA